MSDQYFLYTVTGLREPFYAVVDTSTGRAWTSPTKDGAVRQAREAGIDDFAEQTISRETFLRSLGIEVDPKLGSHRNPPPAPPAPVDAQPAAPPGAWFVPSVNAEPSEGATRHMSGSKPLKQWPATPPKPATPFAASAPIPMPGEEVIAPPDDVLIVPSPQKTSRRKNPFTDKPAAIPDDLNE